MLSTKDILPVTTVKRDLAKLLKELQTERDSVLITKDGKIAGVLMSGEAYDGIMETLDILSDKSLMRDIRKGQEDFRKGRVYSHREVFGE